MSPKIVDQQSLQAREKELLDSALSIIEKSGVAGFNMDKLAALVPYSKGTIYNHFSSKEDLLTGICCQGIAILNGLFGKATEFSGSTRDRVMAQHLAYLLYALLYPNRFLLVLSAMSPALFERASEQRRIEFQERENALLSSFLNVIAEAVERGELTLPNHMSPKQVAFANWSLGFGTIALLAGDTNTCECRRGLSIEHELISNANIMLDGLGWRPLSSEADSTALIKNLLCDIFSEEIAVLESRGITLNLSDSGDTHGDL